MVVIRSVSLLLGIGEANMSQSFLRRARSKKDLQTRIHRGIIGVIVRLIEARHGNGKELAMYWMLERTPIPLWFPTPRQYLEGIWLALWW